MDHLTFFNSLKKEIKPSYVFVGEENFVKESALNTLKSTLITPDTEAFNYSVMSEESELDAVYDTVNTFPFMAEKRLVVWHATKLLKELKDDTLEILRDMLTTLGNTVCLVIVINGNADKRLKYYKILKDNSEIVEFNILSDFEAARWVGSYFSKHKKKIDMKLAEEIVSRIGTSVMDLFNEVEKINVSMGDRQIVEQKDLMVFATHFSEADSFELINYFFSGDVKAGVAQLHQMLKANKKGESNNDIAMQLLGAFSSKLMKCYQVKMLSERKFTKEQIMESMDISKGEAFYLLKDVQRFTKEQLKKCIDTFAYADYAVKNGLMNGAVAIEYAIISAFSKEK